MPDDVEVTAEKAEMVANDAVRLIIIRALIRLSDADIPRLIQA